MEYFSTGVTKDKLMVLHGLKALGMQPTKEQLSDFFGIYDLLGYFAVQNAAYELEEEGLISRRISSRRRGSRRLICSPCGCPGR